MEIIEKIKNAEKYIKSKIELEPEFGLILGSGLGVLAEEIENPTRIPYSEIPGFLESDVEGHNNQLVVGTLEGRNVVALQGRFHYYEGYDMTEITLPVRVMKLLGCEGLIVTNAAGGANRNFDPGDFMLISDHINFMGDNPLIGKNLAEFGPRFPDMSTAYDPTWQSMATDIAAENGIVLRRGVYCAWSGPTYETPAEVRMLTNLGADAVGMSTVPEVIVANHQGMRVLGISCITNMAAGILPKPLDHSEVVEIAEEVRPQFIKFVRSLLKELKL